MERVAMKAVLASVAILLFHPAMVLEPLRTETQCSVEDPGVDPASCGDWYPMYFDLTELEGRDARLTRIFVYNEAICEAMVVAAKRRGDWGTCRPANADQINREVEPE